MTTLSELKYLYDKITVELCDSWDPAQDGTSRKKFQPKYGLALRQMLLHILIRCIERKIYFNPMMIGFAHNVPKTHYLVFDLGDNLIVYNQDIESKIEIPMTPFQNIMATTMLGDYPARKYLFHQSNVSPDKFTNTDMKLMNSTYSKMLTSCSVDKIDVSLSAIKELINECKNANRQCLKCAHLKKRNLNLLNYIRTLEVRIDQLTAYPDYDE